MQINLNLNLEKIISVLSVIFLFIVFPVAISFLSDGNKYPTSDNRELKIFLISGYKFLDGWLTYFCVYIVMFDLLLLIGIGFIAPFILLKKLMDSFSK